MSSISKSNYSSHILVKNGNFTDIPYCIQPEHPGKTESCSHLYYLLSVKSLYQLISDYYVKITDKGNLRIIFQLTVQGHSLTWPGKYGSSLRWLPNTFQKQINKCLCSSHLFFIQLTILAHRQCYPILARTCH